MTVIRWLRSLFAWRVVLEEWGWRYEENSITGKRREVGGYRNSCPHPGAKNWLAGGDFSYERPRPPTTGSGVIPPKPSIFPAFHVQVEMPKGTKPPRDPCPTCGR